MSVTFPRPLGSLAALWAIRSILWGPVAWASTTSWAVATALIGLAAVWLLAGRRDHLGAGALVLGCLTEIAARPMVDDEPALLLAWLGAIVLLTADAPYERAFLLRVNTTTVYVFAAASKVNPSWLSGEGVLGMGVAEDLLGDTLARPFPLMAIAVEAAVAAGLWFVRTRWPAAVLGVLFHVGIVAMVSTRLADVLFLIVLNFGLVIAYPAFWSPRHGPGSRLPTRSA